MHAIAWTHVSTFATSFMHLKIALTTSIYDTYCLGHWNQENKRKNKNFNFNSRSFFFSTFVYPLLLRMLYLHVRLQNKGKYLVLSEYYNQFGIYQPFYVIPLRTMAKQLR